MLTFQEDMHAYWWDGKHYVPSATQILDDNGHVSRFCKDKEAAKKGTDIHRMTQLEIIRLMSHRKLKTEFKKELDNLVFQYPMEFIQFQSFCEDVRPIFLGCESMVCGWLPENRTGIPDWGGTYDWMAEINGRISLGDDKTGAAIPPHARLQVAGYTLAEFPFNYDSIGRYALRINSKYKSYKLIEYNNEEDFEEWRLECRRYHRNNPRS